MTRLHPASAAVSALRSGGQLALFALFASTAFAGMGGGDGPGPVAFLAVPAAFLVGAGAALARWYRFEYEVLSDRLVVRSGVVSRQDREIPLHRVQNVDVRRSILQRALGLATVTVETAGGGATEATLDAVGSDEADRLRAELGRRGRGDESRDDRESASDDASTAERAGTRPSATAAGATAATGSAGSAESGGVAAESETLYELTGRRFATLCAVSFRPGAVIAPFVGASLFDDLLFDGGRLLVRYGIIDVEVGPGDVPSLGTGDLLSLGLLGAVGFLLVVWVVSAALTFVRYYGFRLERVGDELRYERGLLGRYSGTVPLSKVQTVTVSENAVMRRLGYASLAIETAGYAPGSGGGGGGDGGAETAVPLDTRSRVVALADDVRAELGTDADAEVDDLEAPNSPNDPDDPDDAFGVDTVARPPTRARRRYVARYAIAALVATALAVGVDRLVFDLPGALPLLPLVGVALAPIAGHLTWANRGHTTVGDGFVTRTGVLRRHTRLVPYFRLQTVFVSRTVFQRRRNLASVVGDSASSSGLLGGDAIAYDLDAADADALREELLDRLEDDLAARRRVRHDRRRRAEGGATEGEATSDIGPDAGSDATTDAVGPDHGLPYGPDSVATNGRGSGDEESDTQDGDGGKDTEGDETEGGNDAADRRSDRDGERDD
ncbi:PH domain-containing protein [Halobaculum magnesiiphilum]|uniref:PH domain-containing protein n=1 Tax=Halobaculum magnesiiphilum TaxID=1017351 RepID=A0A8T8WDW4_9EURY|nr:PH domain-containing protein [Halobaculum magnesiiphilum]QZP38052.1 PH domain-containing protein [Halobaculum magnesiiphilum]